MRYQTAHNFIASGRVDRLNDYSLRTTVPQTDTDSQKCVLVALRLDTRDVADTKVIFPILMGFAVYFAGNSHNRRPSLASNPLLDRRGGKEVRGCLVPVRTRCCRNVIRSEMLTLWSCVVFDFMSTTTRPLPSIPHPVYVSLGSSDLLAPLHLSQLPLPDERVLYETLP